MVCIEIRYTCLINNRYHYIVVPDRGFYPIFTFIYNMRFLFSFLFCYKNVDVSEHKAQESTLGYKIESHSKYTSAFEFLNRLY